MALVKGPFSIKWGENAVIDVSEVGFNYDQTTNDYETIDGRTLHTSGAITASIELTLLSSDVDTLKVIFPQYYVAPGGTLSTGEEVAAGSEGAIDIVAASCDESDTAYPLDIISCTNDVTRLVNTKTQLSGVDLADNSLRTVTVTFTGEPEQGQGIVQFFKNGEITPSQS